ncbi:mannose-6-phosphate isomerase, class I [Kribbella sp. NBC_01245]|uniref:mannose-6-phosphate isomerase, class I n=1 Tax=Kribbella sp. NBC_01245 TaxID=2903578 RepID=UPI002E27E5A5|nr:mannose-6-phosphate isomerase, class I [Kribbella sp. NBC_01245]
MVSLLLNTVRDYAWGSRTAIPSLLGIETDGRPQAELWMGAHESASSVLADGSSLYDVVTADPAGVLGAEVAERFDGRFPFLAKILAAAQPLSIQAHPSPAQAVEGFAREDANDVPRDAGERNYRDEWPKPEILVALGPFEALVGFRPPAQTAALIGALDVPALEFIAAALRDGKLAEVFAEVMAMDRDAIRPLVAVLGEACRRYEGELTLEAETLDRLAQDFPDDPGVLAALLLNRVRLERFESVYLPAGNVHAYLSGTGFEVMANSDNVLRGGLTRKHIDVPELVSVVDFAPLTDPILRGTTNGPVTVYETGCEYFALRRVDLTGDEVTVDAAGPRIVACLDGQVELWTDGDPLPLAPGSSAFVAGPEEPCKLRGAGTAFVVSVT